MIQLYPDGACINNGRMHSKGAFSFVVVENDSIVHEYAYAKHDTTNNIMELSGVINGLQFCIDENIHEHIQVLCDSKYVVNGINTWIFGWQMNDWKSSSGEPVKNKDLWQELLINKSVLSVSFKWIKGHAGNKYNEYADELCLKALKALK